MGPLRLAQPARRLLGPARHLADPVAKARTHRCGSRSRAVCELPTVKNQRASPRPHSGPLRLLPGRQTSGRARSRARQMGSALRLAARRALRWPPEWPAAQLKPGKFPSGENPGLCRPSASSSRRSSLGVTQSERPTSSRRKSAKTNVAASVPSIQDVLPAGTIPTALTLLSTSAGRPSDLPACTPLLRCGFIDVSSKTRTWFFNCECIFIDCNQPEHLTSVHVAERDGSMPPPPARNYAPWARNANGSSILRRSSRTRAMAKTLGGILCPISWISHRRNSVTDLRGKDIRPRAQLLQLFWV
jgi:hypothetical protein